MDKPRVRSLLSMIPFLLRVIFILFFFHPHARWDYLGRYNKYSRTLSQTPWIIDGIRKADVSVEELIALPIEKLVPAKREKWTIEKRKRFWTIRMT